MVAPPPGASPAGGASFPNNAPPSGPSTGSFQVELHPPKNGIFTNYPSHIPFSQRRAPKLDLATVERRGQPSAARESKRVRPHGLQEAPTFRPSEEDFKDPFEYIRKIRPEAEKYGICKIIPPDSWAPDFCIDTERFFFKTRRQELNSVEGGTRTNIQYIDQLTKFHKQHGINLNRFPSVDKRPLDLYKLKKAVETRGGFEKVCKLKKWAEIGRDLGYSGKIMSSLSTSLKNSYQKWLHPYEEFLKFAKPGIQQQLEYENGGPFTPSSANQSMKGSHNDTPTTMRDSSPAMRASAALNASVNHEGGETFDQPPNAEPTIVSSGFTPVNAGGFTPVNVTPASFPFPTAKANPLKHEMENGTHGPGHHVPHNGGPTHLMPEGPGYLNAGRMLNGHSANPLKRTISHDSIPGGSGSDPGAVGVEGDDQNERRSKRIKKAPTVVGSHMSLLRPATPRLSSDRRNGKPGEVCEVCGTKDDRSPLLICDGCDYGYHKNCLDPPARHNPLHDWHCPRCLVGTGDFGFEEGGIYSLRQFQDKAHYFKESYFRPKMQFDPVHDSKRSVTEDDVEREFWRLVESPNEEVEVEYGADIHSTSHGSGFPTVETGSRNPYSKDYWNLNNLPLHPDSLFNYIKSDISGMTIPWLYVGMCFSTFCWHNEDHYGYSANYQHFGATKTWYGIPGSDAEHFEQAMKEAVPELFESQPDLLFQLVTLLPPDRLKKAGVNVYALDQRAGQFVITFPQAYHAGFNHGFNFNEAVNFAPHDWEAFGEAGVQRLQAFRKQPCFSHDELLMTAAVTRDMTIKTAKWLAPALKRLRDRELSERDTFLQRHKECFESHQCPIDETTQTEEECTLTFQVRDEDVPEHEYQCAYCKAYSYLSSFRCNKSGKVMCLLHAGSHECCDAIEEQRFKGVGHTLRYRLTNSSFESVVQKTSDRANSPEAWQDKLDKAVDDEERPSLKVLRSLLSEGEKIPWNLPGLPDLKKYVNRCNEWVEEATNYITRKQQNRRKNERAWRKGNSAKAAEVEEREKELRKIENIQKLLAEADQISFDCPEITALSERAEAIKEFQRDAKIALEDPKLRTTQELEELAEMGKGFNVDIPEVEKLETFVQRMHWINEAEAVIHKFKTLDDVRLLIERGVEIGIPPGDPNLMRFRNLEERGTSWEDKAKELMAMEVIHHPQLEALSTQADTLPITNETRAAVDAILSKQREAQKQIISLYKGSKDPDFRKRPKYKEARDVLEGLSDLNSKPNGTVDLENAVKRHENWMRKGKKLFGKANAPLHILQAHMNNVAEHNRYCFDLEDKPRMPVEPASRDASPADDEDADVVKSEKNVFCMCRQPEAGTMLECDMCHEWYHCKCLKIARGKVKEDDRYTCPICDHRVKIPRDADRPKLEDLIQWQEEIPDLPFQPEEEEVLQEIIDVAQTFRNKMYPLLQPALATGEQIVEHRFFLRKIEGAEILLTTETNFFRQELHRWVPVTSEAPPILEQSRSTRKPRPTKQQKLMQQHGVNSPDELPLQFRTKPYNIAKARKGSDPKIHPAPPARRQGSAHSTSTTNSTDLHTHSHRLPPAPLSTAGIDPTYAAHYPLPASHNPHHRPESPSLHSPYYSNHNGVGPHSPYLESPRYGASRSPLSATQQSLDPNIFNAASTPFDHPHSRVGSPPSQHGYMNTRQSQDRDAGVDQIFDQFVNQDEDVNPRNEFAEALEDRGREREADEAAGEKALRDFVQDP